MIVVTGASGFVGGNLIRTLVHRGYKVRATMHIDKKALEGVEVEVVPCDVRDPESLKKAFRGADVVYHAAGKISLFMRDWPILQAINVHGVQNVVDACLSTGVRRLVHFSSIHAFCQEPMNDPINETRPLVHSHKCPPYDRSKAAGEQEIRKGIEKGLDAVIINPTGIIGPYDFRPSHTGQMILMIARGTLPALVKGGFNWVDVRDVVDGTIHICEQAPRGAKYLLGGHWASIADIAREVQNAIGARLPKFTVPIWLARIGSPFLVAHAKLTGKPPLYTEVSLRALEGNSKVEHAKASTELQYQPRPFRKTIEDTVNWFADNKAI